MVTDVLTLQKHMMTGRKKPDNIKTQVTHQENP